MVAMADTARTAMVTVLMPPAVPTGDPPTNISRRQRIDEALVIAEELADIQEACETAMAILGLTEGERRTIRKKVLCKNASRGYYND